MIAELEQRLAEVLGTRLGAPFAGNVEVAPGGSGAGPRVVLGAEHVEVTPAGIGDAERLVVPGDAAPRRVVRGRCAVRLRVAATGAGARDAQRRGQDALLFALDAPDVRSGAAFAGGAPDPGFVVRGARVRAAALPLDDAAEVVPGVTLDVEGLFWPVGAAGQAGPSIAEARVRGVLVPISLDAGGPLVAGGGAVDLALRARPVGGGDGPFRSLALRLVTPAGAPGAGTLVGAADGVLFVDLADGEATVTLRPPAEAGTEILVVALDDREGGVGLDLARFPLDVEAP